MNMLELTLTSDKRNYKDLKKLTFIIPYMHVKKYIGNMNVSGDPNEDKHKFIYTYILIYMCSY